MMLPPVDPGILAANPKFAILYRHLSTKCLNEDGSSRIEANPKALKNREVLSEGLRKARLEYTKRCLVQKGLSNIQYSPEELPDELRELAAIVAASLSNGIDDSDLELVSKTLESLEETISPLATVLSETFHQDLHSLTQLLPPLKPPSKPPTLTKAISTLQQETSLTCTKTAQSRLTLAHSLSTLHALHREILETCIRALEQTLHGSLARASKAKADYLCTVAEGMAGKLGVQRAQLMQQVYSPEVVAALQERVEEIERETRGVKRKVREAEERLEAYGRAKGMRAIAEEYAEVMGEMVKVKAEIARLEK